MSYGYIAIEGNIGAGKTSLSTRLAEDFNGQLVLEEFADNPFLPKFYEHPERFAFPLELSFLAERFSQLKTVLTNRNLFRQLVVADYFIDKSLIFARNNLKDDEFALFHKTFQLIRPTIPNPELLLYLYLPVDILKENIKKRGRPYEQNISPEYLDGIQKQYFSFLNRQKQMRVVIVDTSSLDFVNNPADYQFMMDLVKSPWKKGIHRVNP
jgi:deoxyguanosine kinase